MNMGLLLPAIEGLDLVDVQCEDGQIRVEAQTTCSATICPSCEQKTERVHSFYGRTIQDLPWSGCPVTINLRVRRFFCDNANCKRLVFCERLAPHIASYGRHTDRQRKLLQMLAVAMGGEMTARLLPRLGLSGSPAMLLNAIRAMASPVSQAVCVVGVDDWAKRKGHVYRNAIELVQQQLLAVSEPVAAQAGGNLSVTESARKEQGKTGQAKASQRTVKHFEKVKQLQAEGCTTYAALHAELIAMGYKGSYTSVRRAVLFLSSVSDCGLRPANRATPVRPRSARQAARLLVRLSDKLAPEETQLRDALCSSSAQVATAHELAQTFCRIVRQHRADDFDTWLTSAHDSGVTELHNFADGLVRDYAAVKAALTLPWSNGPVEGHVNKLKVLKRQMYGRAKLDLLRKRFLYAA